jgi:hypothetical protein
MFHYMTQTEYLKRIEDDLLEQRRLIRSSKAAAAELIDSLGIRHLLIPMTEEEIKVAENEMAKWEEE